MSFKDLTVEQVRDELAKLIANYPDRKGGIYADGSNHPDELSCVYYMDDDGQPVSRVGDYEEADIYSLVVPVCIIGQWVEDFHPELKRDENFQLVLLQNAVIACSVHAARTFGKEVFSLLSRAQSQQDDGTAWEDIKL